MIKSILKILGRICLILLAAALLVGLAYGLSKTNSGAARFRAGDGPGFASPRSAQGGDNQLGQQGRPPRGPGGDEGFRENGSITRGLVELLTNSLLIGVFTCVGLLLFRRKKRSLPTALQPQVDQ